MPRTKHHLNSTASLPTVKTAPTWTSIPTPTQSSIAGANIYSALPSLHARVQHLAQTDLQGWSIRPIRSLSDWVSQSERRNANADRGTSKKAAPLGPLARASLDSRSLSHRLGARGLGNIPRSSRQVRGLLSSAQHQQRLEPNFSTADSHSNRVLVLATVEAIHDAT